MNISDYIAFGSLAVSVVTSICSYHSYKKYGRKLNEQQMQINEYILSQQENADYKSRCADLKCSITKRSIIVRNEGMADATGIELTFPSKAIVRPTTFPVKIKSIAPNDNFEIDILRASSPLKVLEIHISWLDGRGVRQRVKRDVSLS